MISNFCTLGWDKQPLISNSFISHLITPILKSLVVPVFNWCDLFTNCAIFFFKSHLFPNQTEGYTKNQLDFKACFKVTNQIEGKWKTKSIMKQILQLLFPTTVQNQISCSPGWDQLKSHKFAAPSSAFLSKISLSITFLKIIVII